MLYYVKPYLKILSIIVLIVFIIRSFVKCKGSLRGQAVTGIYSSLLGITILYIANN